MEVALITAVCGLIALVTKLIAGRTHGGNRAECRDCGHRHAVSDVHGRAPAPELNPKWACKHPEDSLLEVRSDVMKKSELVATLCTKCDVQLGPEVWQAIMDRKFDEWTRETQTKLEADAAREAKNAELRAEQADLEMWTDEALQGFLADAKLSLAKMEWGVSDSQDRKRTEIAANCKKWRGELERRGVKEVPSWKRRLGEQLLPAKKADTSSLYVQVVPDLKVLESQLGTLEKRTDAVVTQAYENLIAVQINTIAKTFCIPEAQLRQAPIDKFSAIIKLVESGMMTREAALEILEADNGIREAYELKTWGQAEPVARIEVKPVPKVSWDW